jgi:hypothetical protein
MLISLLFIIAAHTGSITEISNEVAAAIKAGNASEVIKYCANTVDLKVLDKENVYSRAQAELIIKDFFLKKPVKSFSIVHQGSSKSGDRFTIGTYETTGGETFRTYFLFKKEGEKLTIQQMRFETQDE